MMNPVLNKQEIIEAVRNDLRCNRLTLPGLPEIALQVRKTVENPAASAAEMAQIISKDPAISARLLHVTNSALYRARAPVTSVQLAIARLGQRLVRNLASTLVMEQLYKQKLSPKLREFQTTLWKHSVDVAALSCVLAREFTGLDKDEAMLAGLIHDIGKLPILFRIESVPMLLGNMPLVQTILDELHHEIGTMILVSWKFPESLVRSVAGEKPGHPASLQVEICDIVAIANRYSEMENTPERRVAMIEALPGFPKLGVSAREIIAALDDADTDVREIRQLLAA